MECGFLVSDLYFNPNVCHTCKSFVKHLKKCTGCHMISYCSKHHQKLHWPSHKPLCLCLQTIKKNLGHDFYSQFKMYDNLSIKNKSQIEAKGKNISQVTVEKSRNMLKEINEQTKEGCIPSRLNNLSIKDETSTTTEKCFHESLKGEHIKIIRSGETSSTSQGTSDEKHENIANYSNKDWIQYKFSVLHHVEILLGRNLRNVEKEIVLKPKCCFVCKQRSELITCESCLSVNYCDKHELAESHALLCEQYTLLYKINKYIVDKFLHKSFAYIERISNFLEPYKYDNNMEYYELSEYTSFYRTLVFLVKFVNVSSRSLTVHVVGASEYECSPYSVYLWENIFHSLTFIDFLVIKFVGFDVTADQFDLRLCENCMKKQRKLSIECHQMSYDSYIDSQKDNVDTEQLNINADMIVAFNAGFHEFESQINSNTWTKTLNYFLKTKKIPIAFTGYTKDEIIRDSEIIKSIALTNHAAPIDFILQEEVNSEASKKPRIDPEDGVYYLNKYISCFYCK